MLKLLPTSCIISLIFSAVEKESLTTSVNQKLTENQNPLRKKQFVVKDPFSTMKICCTEAF